MQNSKRVPFLTADIIQTSPNNMEISLYSPETDTGFVVDGYAAVLCTKFVGDKTLEDLIREMVAEYNLPEEAFASDVNAFIQELEPLKLVRWLEYSVS